MAGVIGHIRNPDAAAAVELAQAAERADADWIGLADAFWWRDVWMLLADVAAGTERIEIGPAMTNAYLRHPFHTAAALATLQERAGERVFCGIAAGGSELAAAGSSRRDAPDRVHALVALLREVSGGAPLDATSGRTLELKLHDVPVLIAARGNAMLAAAGACADRVLLWAMPDSDLERSVDLVLAGASERAHPPELHWAPLVRLPGAPEAALLQVAVYACINTVSTVRQRWGLDEPRVSAIRSRLIARGDRRRRRAGAGRRAGRPRPQGRGPRSGRSTRSLAWDRAHGRAGILGCQPLRAPGVGRNCRARHCARVTTKPVAEAARQTARRPGTSAVSALYCVQCASDHGLDPAHEDLPFEVVEGLPTGEPPFRRKTGAVGVELEPAAPQPAGPVRVGDVVVAGAPWQVRHRRAGATAGSR